MTVDNADHLKLRLRELGLSDAAITAAWPRWWTDEADGSTSARAELRFGVARRLGLDPRSLVGGEQAPRFLWRNEARFKHLSGEEEVERAGITSFGRAVASVLVQATPPADLSIEGAPAAAVRQQLLDRGRPYVDLFDLLSLAWGVGIPAVHLRVFPWPQKRMAAMTVSAGERPTVLLGKDSNFAATIAFYVAHELGHIALGHVKPNEQIVDMGEVGNWEEGDDEEHDADAFALEVLTGDPSPTVLPLKPGVKPSGSELARIAIANASELRIEPGTLALCFGYSTGNWDTANVALRRIYGDSAPVWRSVNGIAVGQLHLDEVADEAARFVEAILGSPGV